ncbi:hypothetical protein H5392_09370 [Tessaracoccus sp. MC1865]|uniref:hypothetical protein n=1 Tax=Tessaracoccus sp. MC1865 TaxID=2760310 RepID=UPI001604690E|nr:hypothetical protein [Tessaracoccus sp. MC1865]MBB1484068.1 hypothetical protein [Tessaracoccus sp. MC1865]QTO37102.1 hypothetical protein J7D54_11740 [Tessaracoccus sp. MC1865]
MRATWFAAPAAALLLLPACAPDSMVSSAVSARQLAPSFGVPKDAADEELPEEVVAAEKQAEAAAEVDEVMSRAAARSSELTSMQSAGAGPDFQPTNGWEDRHIHNVAYSQLHLLEEASPAFRDYAENAMTSAGTDGCTVLGLSVMSKHQDGFILGTISTDCGGGQAIWGEDGETRQWHLLTVLQATPDCAELTGLELPTGVGLVCNDDQGKLAVY